MTSPRSTKGERGDRELMQGEDPQSPDPQDARTWIGIYDELIRFKASEA